MDIQRFQEITKNLKKKLESSKNKLITIVEPWMDPNTKRHTLIPLSFKIKYTKIKGEKKKEQPQNEEIHESSPN